MHFRCGDLSRHEREVNHPDQLRAGQRRRQRARRHRSARQASGEGEYSFAGDWNSFELQHFPELNLLGKICIQDKIFSLFQAHRGTWPDQKK